MWRPSHQTSVAKQRRYSGCIVCSVLHVWYFSTRSRFHVLLLSQDIAGVNPENSQPWTVAIVSDGTGSLADRHVCTGTLIGSDALLTTDDCPFRCVLWIGKQNPRKNPLVLGRRNQRYFLFLSEDLFAVTGTNDLDVDVCELPCQLRKIREERDSAPVAAGANITILSLQTGINITKEVTQ